MVINEEIFTPTTNSSIINNALHDGHAFLSIGELAEGIQEFIEVQSAMYYGTVSIEDLNFYKFIHNGKKYYAFQG